MVINFSLSLMEDGEFLLMNIRNAFSSAFSNVELSEMKQCQF